MTIKEQAIKWVQEYFAANGNENTKAIIGISGGKDSSTVAALCCAAHGSGRQPRVYPRPRPHPERP